jgi:hypothetical protein
MTPSSNPADPIAQAWRTARAWCAQALAEFGGAAAIAAVIARQAYAACRRRLALVESFVTKLLLIEAAQLPSLARAVETRSRTSGSRRQPPRASEDPANPASWRVRFHARLAPIHAAPARAAAAPHLRARLRVEFEPSVAQAKAHALARRFEALRRVIADPRRAILALARRLAALGVRAYAVAHRIALAAPRQGGGMDFAHVSIFALDASVRWLDSS